MSKEATLPQVRPSELPAFIASARRTRIPLFVAGHMGIGKSEIIAAYPKREGIGSIVSFAPYFAPEDIKFPYVDHATQSVRFVVPGNFPTVANIKAGRVPKAGLWQIEELPSAPPAIQALLSEPLLNHTLNGEPIGEEWFIVATGNLVTSKCVVNRKPAHVVNRMRHVELVTNLEDWATHALEAGMEAEPIAFLRSVPTDLFNFDPVKWIPDTPFASPRSWAFMSRVLKDQGGKVSHAECTSVVGEAAGTRFKAFLDAVVKLPNLDICLMDPENAPVPEEPAMCYMVACGLAKRADKENFERVIRYMTRLDKMYEVFCVRDSIKLTQKLCNTPAFVKWASANQDVLKG